MDMSLVSSVLAAQTGNLQTNVAMRLLKMNSDAQTNAVQVLLGVPGNAPSQANVAAGVGGNLDVSA
jgi:hypothetical protein